MELRTRFHPRLKPWVSSRNYHEDDVGHLIDKKESAQRFLARIRRLHRDNSKYDFIGLLSFLPIIGKYFKPSKEREWCSENVATVHKKFGASFITDTKIAPDQLFAIVKASSECVEIENYYKM